MKVTAAIIAKDEARNIADCVRSASFCDEVLVVDSGSTDGTPDLARAAGARVVVTDWPGWVAQKNRAAGLASHDWVLSLDADERVDARLRAEIERIRAAGEPAVPGYEVTRHVFYLGRWIDHGGWFPEWRTRLFHRARARWVGVDPHDRLETDGAPARIEVGELQHFTYRSIAEHVRQIDRFTTVAAQEKVARGARASLLPMLVRPPARFLKMYVLRRGFLDGRAGFFLAAMAAWYVFLKYAKVWELQGYGRKAAP